MVRELGDCIYKLACYDNSQVVPNVSRDNGNPMSKAPMQVLLKNQHVEIGAAHRHLRK
jgi:hypothetical protein